MTNKNDSYNKLNNPEKTGYELSKIKKENNFQVPENYFNELPQVIQQRVTQQKAQFIFINIFNYLTKPYRLIALSSLVVLLIVGVFFIANQKIEDQVFVEFSFEDIMEEYPEMIEYMDDQVLMEFAAVQMDDQEIDFFDYESGIDPMLSQDEVLQQLSDEEISEIIYNL